MSKKRTGNKGKKRKKGFSEKEAKSYLAKKEIPLKSISIPKKDDLSYRVINCLPDDRMLKLVSAPEFFEKYRDAKYHKRQIKRLYVQLQRYIGDLVHGSAYGYGQGKTHTDAVLLIKAGIEAGNPVILRGDIKKFFNNVCQEQLLELLTELIPDRPELLALTIRLQQLDRYGEIFNTCEDDDDTLKSGIIQGLSPSTLLANIYLKAFDNYCSGLSPFYARYVDDFALCFPNREAAEQALTNITAFLAEGYPTLSLHPEKTRIFDASDTEFLGYRFREDRVYLTDLALHCIQARLENLFLNLDLCRLTHETFVDMKSEYKNVLDSISLQLSILDDTETINSLWKRVTAKTWSIFNLHYPSETQKRMAMRELGIPMGTSIKLLRGKNTSNNEIASPFSKTKMVDVLLHELSICQKTCASGTLER